MQALRRTLLVVVGGLLLCWAGADRVAAHSGLVDSSPRAGQHLDTPPSEIVLEFGDAVRADRSVVAVSDGDGVRRELRPTSSRPGVLMVRLSPSGAAGVWSLEYRVVSADGHVVVGGHPFTVGREVLPEQLHDRKNLAVRSAGVLVVGISVVLGALLLRRTR